MAGSPANNSRVERVVGRADDGRVAADVEGEGVVQGVHVLVLPDGEAVHVLASGLAAQRV